MYKINYNHLYNFFTIASKGSIVSACETLNITQPAMSHQLSQLESDIGKKLFDRVGRRLVLNKNGKIIFKYAREIFKKSDEMIEVVNSSNLNQLKIVRIGVTCSLSQFYVFELIKPMLKCEQTCLQVLSGDMNELIDRLLIGDIDIIFCDFVYPRNLKKINLKEMNNTKISCYSNLGIGESIRDNFLSKFRNCRIVNYTKISPLRGEVDAFLNELEYKPTIFGEVSDASLVRCIIENSNYIGFLPQDMGNISVANNKLIMVHEVPSSSYNIYKYTLK